MVQPVFLAWRRRNGLVCWVPIRLHRKRNATGRIRTRGRGSQASAAMQRKLGHETSATYLAATRVSRGRVGQFRATDGQH